MHSCANIHGMHALILKVLAEGMLYLDENTVEQQPQYGFMSYWGTSIEAGYNISITMVTMTYYICFHLCCYKCTTQVANITNK